jgi:hypothetical protein
MLQLLVHQGRWSFHHMLITWIKWYSTTNTTTDYLQFIAIKLSHQPTDIMSRGPARAWVPQLTRNVRSIFDITLTRLELPPIKQRFES